MRRVPKKSDFLRYIAYEMALEQLRQKRATRLGGGRRVYISYDGWRLTTGLRNSGSADSVGLWAGQATIPDI